MYCKLPDYTGPFKGVIPKYIEFKRGLGYDYGYVDLYRLREIDLFFKKHGVTEAIVTEEMFDRWTALREGESETNRRRRSNKLIAFAKYLRSRGYPNIYLGELPRRVSRPQPNPYVFTKTEIALMFDAAQTKTDRKPENRDYATFFAMLSLYYGCGLRKTEAQDLQMIDVDFNTGCIRIMDSKNHISRLVVVSESVRVLLSDYRDRHCSLRADSDRLFQSGKSPYFSDHKLYNIYREILVDARIPPRENGRLPRLHDLRHTFCVHALESMAKKGFDLYVSLPLLVKYLGHKCISETEYYLRLVGENFTSVSDKSKAYMPTLFPKAGDIDGE
jgi:integrase